MATTARVSDPRPSESGSPVLWYVFLAGPISWSFHLLVSYPLVEPACALRAPLMLHFVTLVAMAPVALAGWISYRKLRHGGDPPASGEGTTAHPFRRFIWQGGVALSGVFLYVIAMEGLPVAILSPCWR